MPKFSPLLLIKLILWIAVVVSATRLLQKRKVSSKLRFFMLAAGVIVFGVIYAFIVQGGVNPSPVLSLRGVLSSILVKHTIAPPLLGMLIVLLVMGIVSNKSLCGWGCQLGLLQDLLFRVPTPKWKPPFWLSNSVRSIAFIALVGGMAWATFDWIAHVDPFLLFSSKWVTPALLFVGAILLASLFIYRPWCQFLCPFGLVSWVLEQVSILRPRIDHDKCLGCKNCVDACPTGAMADFYEDKKIHADCFSCGACIAACPRDEALMWRGPRRGKNKETKG